MGTHPSEVSPLASLGSPHILSSHVARGGHAAAPTKAQVNEDSTNRDAKQPCRARLGLKSGF